MTGLLPEGYERCELEAKKPVANDSGQYLFAAVNIRKYSPANVGMAHSNQRNFLEHSEEPYNTIPSTIFKHMTCKDCHAYLLNNPRLLGKILLKDLLKNMN